MRGFLKFVKKETLHILRDSRTMLIALLMPVVQILLFGFAISTEVNNVNVAVVVPKWSEDIRQCINKLAANPYITYKGSIAEHDIDQYLRSGHADAIVFFAHDYDNIIQQWKTNATGNPSKQFIMDASNTNVAQAGAGYLSNILTGELQQSASLVETHMLFNPQMKSAFNFVPGIMGMVFILICAILTSVSIVREKETGTMDVLLVSPVRPMLEIPLTGNLASIIIVSLVYLVLSLSLGLLVSTVAKTQVVALLVSAAVMLMPIVMLSGMMFPIENMPAVLQPVSAIVPARWYIDAMRKLMIQGAPFGLIMKDFVILVVMTLGLLTVALKNFKDKLE